MLWEAPGIVAGPHWRDLDWLKGLVRWRWQFDNDPVAGPDLAVFQDDAHDASLANEGTTLISIQYSGHESWLEAVQLDAWIAQTCYLDDCRLAQVQARPGWKSE